MDEPRIIAVERDYLVAYKPHRMHGAPLRADEGDTLLGWASSRYPEVLEVQGKKAIEGGLLHRLDYETEGLMLIARSQFFYDEVSHQQDEGQFLKEYVARCSRPNLPRLPGFPPPPAWTEGVPFAVESSFRAYGPGRKAVRPVTDSPGSPIYRTDIFDIDRSGPAVCFSVRLSRGFRHQIRCHLAWLGWPILGDSLYSPVDLPLEPTLGLSATGLSFVDSVSGERLSFTLGL